MKQYTVTGMKCAACQARVEKVVKAVPGVTECAVSLLTNSMTVEGKAPPERVIQAVVKAGFGAAERKPANAGGRAAAAEDALADRESPALLRRLLWSLLFVLPLMYLSMGVSMGHFPLPPVLEGNPMAVALLQLLLACVVLAVNRSFFTNGAKGLVHGAPNMDTLVGLGSAASFVYSVCRLFLMSHDLTRGAADGAVAVAEGRLHDLYFDSAAMILALITVGKLLEARAKGKTTNALRSLMRLAPETAVVLRDGVETVVPAAEVRAGDRFVVRPGDRIPADGVVLEGESAVDESALTGESVPADKAEGSRVSAATVNQSGRLVCEAVHVGEDTTLSRIIRMVGDAAATKAPIAKTADRVAGIFVPTVMGIALVTTIVWLLVGKSVGFSLARGISVLVISCPCALGLATPVAIMVGSGVGARHGLLFKTAVSLEETGRVRTVVLDKTGTITQGTPRVTDLCPAEGVSEDELGRAAYSLEILSEHPLSRAVTAWGAERGFQAVPLSRFRALPGNGLEAYDEAEDVPVYGGNLALMEERLGSSPAPSLLAEAERLSGEGRTPLYFARGARLLGLIAVADVIKEETPAAIQELRDLGLRVVLLTGDNPRTARAIAREAGLDERDVTAGVLPDGKEAVIRELQRGGKVAMVGDGINDAPALTAADMGLAIGAGADVAVDAADVVLVNSRLTDVPAAMRLSRATLRNIRENLFWAFCYNLVGIPLAAGVWIPVFGWELNPMFGAAAMSLSSCCVVCNALRLNLFNIRNTKAFRRKPSRKAGAEGAPAA